ncbi:hypothetical protein D920_01434 [Enterococcus faecalis 13-SD-W-01]|nr:hypothetical protein D920_01434 [Enterococcus faecalis 13-SD-W-01]
MRDGAGQKCPAFFVFKKKVSEIFVGKSSENLEKKIKITCILRIKINIDNKI